LQQIAEMSGAVKLLSTFVISAVFDVSLHHQLVW